MPPKAKFTREEIIDAAIQIVRGKGMEAVTARELGTVLGSSARPIFTVFDSMEEVNEEILKAAKHLYKLYVKQGLEESIAFRGVGLAYIRFAVEEPRLFQLLFMKEQGETKNIENILPFIDESYEAILQSVQGPYQLSKEDAQTLYQHLWIYTHGIATLIATGVCTFTAEEIQTMITDVFTGLIKKYKE